MQRDFICPNCSGHLKVEKMIAFSVKSDSGKSGLVFLSPSLGDYKVHKHPSLRFVPGEHIDFFCPICHFNLIVEKNGKKFTRVMMEEFDEESEILFSQIAGEKCTFVFSHGRIEGYGEDAGKYANFFGEHPKH